MGLGREGEDALGGLGEEGEGSGSCSSVPLPEGKWQMAACSAPKIRLLPTGQAAGQALQWQFSHLPESQAVPVSAPG